MALLGAGCQCPAGYGPGGPSTGCVKKPPPAVFFPGLRLITPEWGKQLNEWAGIADQEWALCYSSFRDNSSSPAMFHELCDRYTNTLSVAYAEGMSHTFGGFVRFTSPVSFVRSCFFDTSLSRRLSLVVFFCVCGYRRWARGT